MYRPVLLAIPLLLTACGGKAAATLTVICAGAAGSQLQ